MSQEITLILIFLIWIFSAYFGSFSSGWAWAVSISLMVLLGIPPQMAGITFKLWKIGDRIGGIYLFHKNGKIPKRFIIGWSIAVMSGWFLGSFFISRIPDTTMYLVSAISMIILVLSSLSKNIKVSPGKISKLREHSGYIGYFICSILGNLFPAGSGVWYYFLNTLVFKLSPIESKWIASFVSIFWFIGTLSGILISGFYHLPYAFALGFGMIIWGYFGTKHMIGLWEHIMKKILLSSILIFALYFFYLGYNSWV